MFINFEPITDTTEILSQEKFNLSISPNPTDGIVKIQSGLERPYDILVYDIKGVLVFSKASFTDGIIDLNFLHKGMYFITINNGIDMISKRIVVK